MAYREQIQAISILKPHLKIIPFPIHTALNLTNASIEYGIGQPARSQAKREAGQICSESKRRQSVPVLRRRGTSAGGHAHVSWYSTEDIDGVAAVSLDGCPIPLRFQTT